MKYLNKEQKQTFLRELSYLPVSFAPMEKIEAGICGSGSIIDEVINHGFVRIKDVQTMILSLCEDQSRNG